MRKIISFLMPLARMRTFPRFFQVSGVLIVALSLVLGLGLEAQTVVHNDSNADTHYLYRLITERSLPNKVELEFDGTGRGSLAFVPPGGETIKIPVNLKRATFANFAPLFDALDFFKSDQAFQSEHETPKAGLVTIGFKRGTEERRVSFNNTDNGLMTEIRDGMHAIASQEYRAYLLDRALRDMPDMLPDALKLVGDSIRNHEAPDPARFVPELQDVASRKGIDPALQSQAQELIKLVPVEKAKSN